MAKKIKNYINFSKRCLNLLMTNRVDFFILLTLSLLAALTEGLGISLIAPILESQGSERIFANIPIFGKVTSFLAFDDANESLRWAAGLLFAILLFRGLLQYGVSIFSTIVPLKIQRRLIKEIYEGILEVEISFIDKKESGEIIAGIKDLPARVTTLLTAFSNLMWNSLLIITYLILMAAISWKLTIISIVVLGVISGALIGIAKNYIRFFGETVTTLTNQLNQTSMETLVGIRLIRLSAAENMMTAKFSDLCNSVLSVNKKLAYLVSLPAPFLVTAAGMFICVLIYVGTYTEQGKTGEWVGQLLLFLFLISRMITPMSAINVSRSQIYRDLHAFEETERFRDECKRLRTPQGNVVFKALQQEIIFNDVNFNYSAAKNFSLKDIKFNISRGEMIAIVGPSGAGKSTLVSLLARLYDPQKGSISIDGIDLQEFQLRSWRGKISVVSQETTIFNDTVFNNLAFARPEASIEEVKQAAKLAVAEEFILDLPDQYDTILGERGTQLSGGQNQRLSIARAVLAPGELLILDEPTSNLDSITEQALQHSIKKMRGECTIIVIAHRLSTIQQADKIIVLDKGEIIDVGPHEALRKRCEIYKNMLQHQRFNSID